MQTKTHGKHRMRTVVRILFLIFALGFSSYLMIHTFSYDPMRHDIRIATKAWSDFGAHIPLIRSFSYGPNLERLFSGRPVESPLFPGEPIRYHFGFYALAGMLEKLGVRIDWALNIPSIAGFFLLLLSIWGLSFALFGETQIAFLSVLFFLCNSSLSFLRFFAVHPISLRTVSDIVTNSRFPAFGPWDGGDITAFWTLNIYTNQRHLALSYGIVLTILLWLLRDSRSKHAWRSDMLKGLSIALLSSLLLFINFPAVAIMGIFCLSFFVLLPRSRRPLLVAGILTLPALFLLSRAAHIGSSDIAWQPGYLAAGLTFPLVAKFWWDNLGVSLFFIPFGLILVPRNIRRLFIGPMLIVFILPNLFRFSPDMINNHKFFNFFIIIGNMFSAYAITTLTKRIARAGITGSAKPWRRVLPLVSCVVGIFLTLSLTLSGIIDFFPIVNDFSGGVADIASNADTRFYLAHTSPGDVIANSTWFYHPASLAGRSLFSGYTYFTWSYGYNQSAREQILGSIYSAPDTAMLCSLLNTNHISHVELSKSPESYLSPNIPLWDSLTPVFTDEAGGRIFSSDTICKGDTSPTRP